MLVFHPIVILKGVTVKSMSGEVYMQLYRYGYVSEETMLKPLRITFSVRHWNFSICSQNKDMFIRPPEEASQKVFLSLSHLFI